MTMLNLDRDAPPLEAEIAAALAIDYERFATLGLPSALEDYVREKYKLDTSSVYGAAAIKNPFGKASGQLSLNIAQARRDAAEGLGFVVLKTVIAQDDAGARTMGAWAIHETRMVIERIKGANERVGWTVTWKGRGWYDTFEKYLELFGEALRVGASARMLVVPSCKYHLPRSAADGWKASEYEYTTNKLLDVWARHAEIGDEAMPLEKDFSPTLAGSDRAAQTETILHWLKSVTMLIREHARGRKIAIGLKMFNAVFDDEFQLEMLRAVSELGGDQEGGKRAPDFLIYANRLFDAQRVFDGVRGVAYGGPDLSARNLSVLAELRRREQAKLIPVCRLPISATGDIDSGRTAIEYLLRGASSFQMHTLFQLPNDAYRMRVGGKTTRGIHEILFNPAQGLIAWLLRLRRMFDWPAEWNIKRMADYCIDPANHLWSDPSSYERNTKA